MSGDHKISSQDRSVLSETKEALDPTNAPQMDAATVPASASAVALDLAGVSVELDPSVILWDEYECSPARSGQSANAPRTANARQGRKFLN